MTDIRRNIGNRIADIRKSKGLTALQLSEMTGLQRCNITRVELGRYNTTIDTLGKIADALNCDIDFVEK